MGVWFRVWRALQSYVKLETAGREPHFTVPPPCLAWDPTSWRLWEMGKINPRSPAEKYCLTA